MKKLQKSVISFLVLLTLVFSMAITAFAEVNTFDSFDKYANDMELSAFIAPHISVKKTVQCMLSDNTAFPASKKSMLINFDVTKTEWLIAYYTFEMPDMVVPQNALSFFVKGEKQMKFTIGIINKDIGYNFYISVTDKWQRVTIPLDQFKNNDGQTLTTGFEKDSIWLSNICFGFDLKTAQINPLIGKIWFDDMSFVATSDIAGLNKPGEDPKPINSNTSSISPTSSTKASSTAITSSNSTQTSNITESSSTQTSNITESSSTSVSENSTTTSESQNSTVTSVPRGEGENDIGWVLPVCIVGAVVIVAGVLLFVFRKKIF